MTKGISFDEISVSLDRFITGFWNQISRNYVFNPTALRTAKIVYNFGRLSAVGLNICQQQRLRLLCRLFDGNSKVTLVNSPYDKYRYVVIFCQNNLSNWLNIIKAALMRGSVEKWESPSNTFQI